MEGAVDPFSGKFTVIKTANCYPKNERGYLTCEFLFEKSLIMYEDRNVFFFLKLLFSLVTCKLAFGQFSLRTNKLIVSRNIC